ncbi:hypothetical protein [uncultured Moraxella sp.]|uniref:hypothetical protein n=1 Tax=uncultured Moraxella sp. TaxID=263769 RepID=UPI0025FFAF59|nr:hypothetical protein [uncultured Moraxella sp.]
MIRKYQARRRVKKSLIGSLIQCIELLIHNNANNQIIAESLIEWINNHQTELADTVFDEVEGIFQFKDLNVLDYPIACTNHEDLMCGLKNFSKFKTDTKTLAMIFRCRLEELFFLETDFDCANCGTGGLIVVKEKSLVYECRTCGFLQDLNGNKYKSSGVITIPTISDLKQIEHLIK